MSQDSRSTAQVTSFFFFSPMTNRQTTHYCRWNGSSQGASEEIPQISYLGDNGDVPFSNALIDARDCNLVFYLYPCILNVQMFLNIVHCCQRNM